MSYLIFCFIDKDFQIFIIVERLQIGDEENLKTFFTKMKIVKKAVR